MINTRENDCHILFLVNLPNLTDGDGRMFASAFVGADDKFHFVTLLESFVALDFASVEEQLFALLHFEVQESK